MFTVQNLFWLKASFDNLPLIALVFRELHLSMGFFYLLCSLVLYICFSRARLD